MLFSAKMKQMGKEDIVRRVCAVYCSFYRPEKSEDLCCKGFSVVRSLIDGGRDLVGNGQRAMLSSEAEDALFQALCRSCPFFESDCDFAEWKRGGSPGMLREDVIPCGGFLFLGSSLDQGNMDIQVINRVI